MTRAYGIDVIGGPSWGTDVGTALSRIRWHQTPRANLPSLPEACEGDDWRLEHDLDRLWVSVEGGASFFLELPDDAPAEVEVHLDGWEAEKASLFFLMGVLPLALPRFKLTPLHGAAFSPDGKSASIVMGDSGMGKTTTLARNIARGASFLADDACAIDDRGMLWPAPPCWASRDEPSTSRHDYLGKAVHLVDHVLPGPIDVSSAIVLRPERGAELGVERLSAHESMLAVIRNQRSPWLFTSRTEQARRLTATAAIASRPVGVARFDQGVHTPDELGDAIDAWADPLRRAPESASVMQ